MELWRYYRILRRRRWLILFCVVACVLPVFIYTRFLTPVMYTGRTRVMERKPTERGVTVYAQPYLPQEIQMHLADLANIATSNSVISRSVETLGQLGIALDPLRLIRTLKVEPVTDTQILQVEITSEDPDEAKSAADVVAAEFQRFYRELVSGATEQSKEFIEKQLKDAKAKLAEAREARRVFKENNDLVSLDAQQTVLIQRMAQIEIDAIQTGVQESDFSSRLIAIERHISSEPAMKLNSESTVNNPIYQELLSRKIALETELGAMRGLGRLSDHPEVKALQKQLDNVDAEIQRQAPKIVSNQVNMQNPVYAQALSNRLTVKAEAAGASARRKALAGAVEKAHQKLRVLPEQELKMAQLNLDVIASEETYRLLRAKLDEARIRANEMAKASAIQVIDSAYVYRTDPKTAMKLALALILSPLLGAGLAFLLNYLDNTVKTSAEAEDLLGLPVVSVVPLARSHALAKRPNNEPLIATYEMLTATLWRTVAKSSSPTVVVASAEPDSGRSITAANLAVTLARDGARVILVDTDMRKPCLHLMFGVQNKPGLSNVLSSAVSIEDAVVPTKIEGLLVMPAGPAPDNPVRLLRSEKMAQFVKEIGSLADFVVFDTPAGITFADASIVASYANNVVIVHAAGRVPRGSEAEFRTKLDIVGANIVGVVLNRVRPEDSHGYFHYRRFYQDFTAQSGRRAIAGEVRAIPPIGTGTGKES